MLEAQDAAQEWLAERFKGLDPIDFEDGVRFMSTSNLQPPPRFEDAWLSVSDHLTLAREDCAGIHAIVIFCNPYVHDELKMLTSVVQHIDEIGSDAPPMFWAPHTERPTGGPDEIELSFSTSPLIRTLLELGLDDILPDEPVGFHLSLAVRAKIRRASVIADTLTDMVDQRRSRIEYAKYLKECIDIMLWDYLRNWVTPSIPAIDPTLPAGEPLSLPGYKFGRSLGQGMYGKVYRLHKRGESCDEVVKAVEKSGVRDIRDLKSMKRMIDIMVLLSSTPWQHPNVVQLYQTYHTPTHIIFRMEYGGPENLYRRLYHRQKPGDTQRPLDCAKVRSLISQAIEAMRHLHVGPRVCHRDIKPENFIVTETDDERIILKVADFDLAIIQEGGQMCRCPCGTVPFSAPEVHLERTYDGFAADTWSLGTVILEVLCGVRLLESSLKLASTSGPKHEPNACQFTRIEAIARKIKQSFTEANFTTNLLRDNIRGELSEIFDPMSFIVDGMLAIHPNMRWNISHAKQELIDANLYVKTSTVFGLQD